MNCTKLSFPAAFPKPIDKLEDKIKNSFEAVLINIRYEVVEKRQKKENKCYHCNNNHDQPYYQKGDQDFRMDRSIQDRAYQIPSQMVRMMVMVIFIPMLPF